MYTFQETFLHFSIEPPNTFRFVVIDTKSPLAHTVQDDQDSPLLSLPHFILKKIASCLPAQDLLESLLLANADLADYLVGKVPWGKLRLDASLDSHRACKLVNPAALKELTCGDLWNEETREEVWNRWRPVLEEAKNLEKLILADVGLLRGLCLKHLVSTSSE